LRAGRWPDTPSGRKVSALAGRLDRETATRMRRYWELHAWLVSEAEETMMEEEQGKPKLHPDEVHAALAELGGLKRALGRSTVTALNAILPFSRNDYWEVAEMKQRLGR
jgi:protease PrsW